MKTNLTTILILIISIPLFAQRQYEWQNPWPSPLYYTSIQALDSNHIYIGGGQAGMLKSEDRGQNWENISLVDPDYHNTIKVEMLTPLIGYGNIYDSLVRTTDGGKTWIPIIGLGNMYQREFHVIHEDTIFGFSDDHGFISHDAGQNWIPIVTNLRQANFHWLNSKKAFTFGRKTLNNDTAAVDYTDDGGQSWTRLAGGPELTHLRNGYAISYDTIVVYGEDSMAMSYDHGSSWMKFDMIGVSFNWNDIVHKIEFINSQEAYLLYGRNSFSLLKTTDGGKNWSDITPILPGRTVKDFDLEDNGTIWLVNAYCNIAYSRDGGQNWNRLDSGSTQTLVDIEFWDDQNGVAVGDNVILYTDDGGQNWRNATLPPGRSYLRDVQMFSKDVVLAIGGGNILHNSYDGGKTWIVSNQIDTGNINDIHFVNAFIGMLGGSIGHNFSRTTNGGQNWVSSTIGDGDITSFSFINQTTGWLTVSGGCQVFKTTNAGASWTKLWDSVGYSPANLQMIDANTGYMSGRLGEILKTTDGGNNWQSLAVGHWDHTDLFFTDALHGWVSDNMGGNLYYTSDGGMSWTKHHFNTSQINGMHFNNDSTGWMVGRLGAILKIGGSTGNISASEELYVNLNMDVYPNPVLKGGDVFLKIPDNEARINIVDMMGKAVSLEIKKQQDLFAVKIREDLKSGVYLIQVVSNDKLTTAKIIVH